MSPGLAKKCGFTNYGVVDWFGIIAGTPKELIDVNDQIREQFSQDFEDENIKIDNHDGMYLVTNNLTDNYTEIPGFSIREVKDLDMVYIWCEIACKGFTVIKEMEHRFIERIKNIVLDNNSKYKFYVGYLKGKPVSTSCLLEHKDDEEVTGLHFLSTLPEVRNQGIGTNTIIETLKQASKKNYYIAVIQTPNECKNIFNKIGFKLSNVRSMKIL